jgi:hypothetical protein
MLVEFAGNQMNFQTISRKGQAVDSGEIQRQAPSGANPSPQALYVPGAQVAGGLSWAPRGNELSQP